MTKNDVNDIFTAGGYGYIAHFNGVTWHEFPTLFNGNYVSLDYKGDLTVAVGYTSRQARLIVIKRK